MKTAQLHNEARTTINKVVSIENETELIKIADEIGIEYGATNKTNRIFCKLGEKPTFVFKNYRSNDINQFYRVNKNDKVIEIIIENSFRKDQKFNEDTIKFILND